MIIPMEMADVPRVAEIHVFGWRSAYRGFRLIWANAFLRNQQLQCCQIKVACYSSH
jgi:hypothetical protein